MERGLRMWENNDGRGKVSPWSDARAATPYAVGDVIYSGNSPEPGRVVSVGDEHISVVWGDGGDDGGIVYPADATYLRKAYPWE